MSGQRRSVPRPSELTCEATIIAAAMLAGWLVHGSRTVRVGKGDRAFATPIKGQPGFPDLVLIRDGVLLVVELKRRPNVVEPEQQRWLDAFRECGVDADVVYVPEEQDALIAQLTKPRRTNHRQTH